MKTVKDILSDVYGTASAAAAAFDVQPSAVSNWISWGHFPSRLLPQIIADADAKGVKLALADIPIHRGKQAART